MRQGNLSRTQGNLSRTIAVLALAIMVCYPAGTQENQTRTIPDAARHNHGLCDHPQYRSHQIR